MAKDRTNSEPDAPVPKPLSPSTVSPSTVSPSTVSKSQVPDETPPHSPDHDSESPNNADADSDGNLSPKTTRMARLAAIKAAVDAGKYDSDELLEIALNKMIQRLPIDHDED